MVIIVVKP